MRKDLGRHEDTNGTSDRLVIAAFLGNAVLAGGNSVAVRFSNRELAPLWGAALRFTVAALILGGIMAAMRLAFPRGRALVGTLLYGLLQFAGAFGFLYYALVRLHAGLGQTLLALVPLATLLLAVAQKQERFRPDAAFGTLLGLAGVALVSRGPLREGAPLLSLLAVLGGILCFAQAAIVVRRYPRVHPVAMNAVGMSAAAVVLILASAISGRAFELPEATATWVALVYVAAVGSIAVFLLYVFVLQRWDASRAAYVMVVIPFITVLLSAWLDDEPVRISLVVGGLLVVAGVYVGALRPARAKPS